ncbi:MAG: creatininase family protein, partial [Longimicrobiales bacterium]
MRETSYARVRETDWEVAVLPWGATEAHNLHLPYGADTLEATAIAEAAAGIAWAAGAGVVALPAVPFGVNTSQLDIPLTINMSPTTLFAVLRDVVRSLQAQGVRKLVVLNAHGGNDARWMIRELLGEGGSERAGGGPGMFLCAIDFWTVLDLSQYFDEPGDHAGELETSLLLHLAPKLVEDRDVWGVGAARPPSLEALRAGWAWTPRPWTRVTDDTGVGNPGAATAEKGRRFFQDVSAEIGRFLADLAKADP